MIDCCHVALALVVIILPLVALLTKRGLKAEARVTKLEKKNGKELAELEKVKQRLDKIEGGKHE